jgi:hypothetical protein
MPVYPRLVRDFYGLLEVVQDYGRGIILQNIVLGHIIQIDPQIIGSIIGVPVLPILANPFTEVLEPPSIEQPRDFFDAQPQGDERAHAHIKIGAFSPQYQLLVKIILHNLWPTSRRSELVLKRDQFLYALSMRMPFCLCKQILTIMLDLRDDHTTGLPFACLVTKICLKFVTDISIEPKIRVHDPFGSQTLMKSNAQQRHKGQGEAPQPPPVQVELPTGASSSQIAPPPPSHDDSFTQVMSALSSIQRDVNFIQREVSSISVRVEQCQLDIQECLKHQHPSHDDED